MIKDVSQILSEYKVDCPKWLPSNIMYETIMGSYAYGVSKELSDIDIYGWCIPPKRIIFPFTDTGHIYGFDEQFESFRSFQKHNINVVNENKQEKVYDVTIFNIVDFFNLCTKNNPNLLETLFTPAHCVINNTIVGQMLREKRHLFLSKRIWFTFKGYAYSSLKKLRNKERSNPKRKSDIQLHGFDTKFSYHAIRLLLEAEQLLDGDMELDKNKDFLAEIRQGKISEDEIHKIFNDKEKELEQKYNNCSLPKEPPKSEIKKLLVECLDYHFSNNEEGIDLKFDREKDLLNRIGNIIDEYRR